jgi:hypothetical protein
MSIPLALCKGLPEDLRRRLDLPCPFCYFSKNPLSDFDGWSKSFAHERCDTRKTDSTQTESHSSNGIGSGWLLPQPESGD